MKLSMRAKKVISWRILSFLVSMVINFFVLGSWDKSLWFTIVLMSVFTVMHYYFEMAWEKFEDRIA